MRNTNFKEITYCPQFTKQDVKIIEELAEHYCQHEFDVLGSGWIKVYHGMFGTGFEGKNYTDKKVTYEKARKELPEFYLKEHDKLMELAQRIIPGYCPIDWQIDFKSGYRFDVSIHHASLKYGLIEGMDAKVSADLGRSYHFILLGLAYRLTGQKKYKEECMAQILDWLAFNPFEHGAGWRSCMNVAIRIANWLIAFDLHFKGLDMESENRDFYKIVQKSVIEHGRFIYNNLEFPETTYHPNHYIANLAGLLMVSATIKEWGDEYKEWYEFSLSSIKEEIKNQIYKDGINYEGATAYHCLVLEMLTYALVFAARADGNKEVSQIMQWIEDYTDSTAVNRLHKMFKGLKSMCQADGTIPLVGDNDSGRFLLFDGGILAKRDWRFLLPMGAVLFKDDSLLFPGITETHWYATQMLLGVKKSPNDHSVFPQSVAFKNAGFYIMREGKDYIFINCGPIGTAGKGGHSHNDKLSFILTIKGLEIFVDPGIYVYTASHYYRNAYRSVNAHNTLSLEGYEQNRYLEDSVWWGCREDTQANCLEWSSGKDIDRFTGEHKGYQRLKNGAVHQRSIIWKKKDQEICIMDKLIPNEKNVKNILSAKCNFIMHPDCVICDFKDQEVTIVHDDVVVQIKTSHGKWETEPALYSPEYGIKYNTQKLVLHTEKQCWKINILTI